MNYQTLCDQVCEVARQAGAFIAEQRRQFRLADIEYKGEQNLVSYVDKEAERIIVSHLSQLLPDADILGEEGTASKESGARHKWVIDPLDGTTNFIHGLPPYCVSIALMEDTEVVVGVIYVVTSDECFSATKDTQAYMNGDPIHVSSVENFTESLVISGQAYDLTDCDKSDFLRLFDYFNRHTHGARRLGSAATNLAYIAAGRAEAFYQVNLSPWDVAAGSLIVRQAGGRVSDFSGGTDYVFGHQIIATNALLYKQFAEIITTR